MRDNLSVIDLDKISIKYETKITVSHELNNISLDVNELNFSSIFLYYKGGCGQNPVKSLLSLKDFESVLNNEKRKDKKNQNSVILKGIYKDGIKGEYCTKSSPFLFFDIDVKSKNQGHKKNENNHLYDKSLNAEIFEKLKKIAVLVWRSNSKYGIAGILYAPQLREYLNNDKEIHLKVCKSITNYIKEKLNISVQFDDAQSRFRQPRYLAEQDKNRKLNPSPYKFLFEIEQVEKKSKNGHTQYTYKDFKIVEGSIREQFNHDNHICDVLIDNDFVQLKGDRYKHPTTSSPSSGKVVDGYFFNHSESFSSIKRFDSFLLTAYCKYDMDFKTFYSELGDLGYKDKTPKKETIQHAEIILKNKSSHREQAIFLACFHLRNLSHFDKVIFAHENAKSDQELSLFYDNLRIKNLLIQYDDYLKVNEHVSEKIFEILDFSDRYHKIILNAETGIGKTTAFVKYFAKARPNSRLLFLVPLTVIADQIFNSDSNNKITVLTGSSTIDDYDSARSSKIVVATYEQGFNILCKDYKFDYLVVDEIHSWISSMSFKSDMISPLVKLTEDFKIIGLTGTPSFFFKQLGYKMIRIIEKNQQYTQFKLIVDNRSGLKKIIQHQRNVIGKSIYRLNNIIELEEAKLELIKIHGFRDKEILLLHSDETIKKGEDYNQLVQNEKFNDYIKVVLTTSLIDEGLNIYQNDFTDVVFIENDYTLSPEKTKQFFARFRDKSNQTNLFCYIKQKVNQNTINWSPIDEFYKKVNNLKLEIQGRQLQKRTSQPNIANVNYLYNADSSINYHYLAYDLSHKLFSTLTTDEYVFFMEANYNTCVAFNYEYVQDTVDLTQIKNDRKRKKELIALHWKNNKDEILNYFHSEQESNQIIEYNVSDEVWDIVTNYHDEFKRIVGYHNKLTSLGLKNTDDIILDKNNGRIVGSQKINRKIELLQNKKTINNPKNRTDKLNQEKLLNFIDRAGKLESFNSSELSTIWNEVSPSSTGVKTYNLIDLVIEYHKFSYNTKKSRYIKR